MPFQNFIPCKTLQLFKWSQETSNSRKLICSNLLQLQFDLRQKYAQKMTMNALGRNENKLFILQSNIPYNLRVKKIYPQLNWHKNSNYNKTSQKVKTKDFKIFSFRYFSQAKVQHIYDIFFCLVEGKIIKKTKFLNKKKNVNI